MGAGSSPSGGAAARDQRRRQRRQSRCRLDAVAALAGQPEEARRRADRSRATGVRSGAKLRRPAQRLSIRRIGKVNAFSIRSTQMATSSSSGCASQGRAGRLVGGRAEQAAGVRLDVPAPPRRRRSSARRRCDARGAWTMSAVRRSGVIPSGSSRRSRPRCRPRRRRHRPGCRRRCPVAQPDPPARASGCEATTSAEQRTSTPLALAPRRKPAWIAATSRSSMVGSNMAAATSSARSGTRSRQRLPSRSDGRGHEAQCALDLLVEQVELVLAGDRARARARQRRRGEVRRRLAVEWRRGGGEGADVSLP